MQFVTGAADTGVRDTLRPEFARARIAGGGLEIDDAVEQSGIAEERVVGLPVGFDIGRAVGGVRCISRRRQRGQEDPAR